MEGFQAVWNGYYPGCRPVGYKMRSDGAKHWLRFHSLPGSKRYADNDQERGILLARQNQLAGEVLGIDAACWLVQTCWGQPDLADVHDPFRACREFNLALAWRFVEIDDEEEDDAQYVWNVHGGPTYWRAGAFDELLLAIANETAAPTLWFSPLTGSVFAPYDGGVDLFLPSLSLVDRLVAVHPDWLSPHPQGL